MSENMQQCPSCGELVPEEYVLCVWCGFDLTAEHIRRSGVRIGRKEAVERMRKVVINPVQAFKEITLIPDLNGGRIIFYLIGVAITLNMLAVFSKLDGLSFNDSGLENAFEFSFIRISVPTVIGIVFLVIQPVVLLVIFTFVWRTGARLIAALSKSFGGSGDQLKIRAVIGYSMLPVLFGWSLAWLFRLVAGKETVNDPNSYESVEEALRNVSLEGIGAVGNFFIVVGWLWATVLGIIGISRATRISIAEAVIVAGIPYILFMTIVT
ncbi:MAG: Yip1 family protein [Candidatus Kariarchaeaceae archaeon]